MGLRDLLERLRRRRAEMLAEGDPDGELAAAAEALDEVVGDRAVGHRRPGDRGPELGRRTAPAGHRRRGGRAAASPSTCCPTTWPGRVRGLQHYDFVSSEAREQFEQLRRGAAPGGGRHLLPGNVRRARLAGPRAAGPHARRLRRPQPDARAARAGRAARPELRGVHGAVRRPVPRRRVPRRAARAAGRSGWRRPRPCGTRSRPSSATSSASWPTPCSRTWTCAGRWSAWPATSSGPSPTPAGARATGSPATRRWASGRPPTWPPSSASSTGWRRSCSRPLAGRRCRRSTSTRSPRHLGEDAARSLDRLARLTRTWPRPGSSRTAAGGPS